MRAIIFLSAFVLLATSFTQAQIIKGPTRVKTAPAPPPPPAPVNKTSAAEATPAPVYSLTSARVKIRTGNDNKEFPSKVQAVLGRRYLPKGEAAAFSQFSLTNEMKINSDTEFGLELVGNWPTERRLEVLQTVGLKLEITYAPNFFADAWKIEGVTLMLEFRDQFGKLHPTLGNKTIVFSNAYGFLNVEYRYLICVTDGSFAPLTAVIKNTFVYD